MTKTNGGKWEISRVVCVFFNEKNTVIARFVQILFKNLLTKPIPLVKIYNV